MELDFWMNKIQDSALSWRSMLSNKFPLKKILYYMLVKFEQIRMV